MFEICRIGVWARRRYRRPMLGMRVSGSLVLVDQYVDGRACWFLKFLLLFFFYLLWCPLRRRKRVGVRMGYEMVFD